MTKPNDPVISIHYIAIFLQLLQEKGIPVSALLAGTYLSAADCKNHEGLVSFLQFERIIENAFQLSQTPELGMAFGRQLNLTTHGDLGMVMMSSQNVQQALEMGVQYLAIRNPLIHLNYVLEKHEVRIKIRLDFAKDAVKCFLLNMTLASIHSMRLYLVGADAGPCQVFLSYPEPKDLKIYEHFFHHIPRFSSPENTYVFSRQELNISLPLADPLTREISEKRCKKKLENLGGESSWASRVQRIMLARPGYLPSLEEVSTKLFVSSRTLRRHLESESESFQNILSTLKQEMAEDYLRSTNLSIAEISDTLNYSDSSNFASAFKKKSGLSPRKFREKFRGD